MAQAAGTVDSSDAGAALEKVLWDFPPTVRATGARLHRQGKVTELVRQDDLHVAAIIEEHVYRHKRRHIVLWRRGSEWLARCTCMMSPRCEHVFATALAWMAHLNRGNDPATGTLDPTDATALAASLGPPRPPSFRQQWEPVLAQKLGRPLSREEGAFLGQLSATFHSFQQSRQVTAWDLARLDITTPRIRERPYGNVYEGWWDQPPRDPMELWQYIAYDLESSGAALPEFLKPVTNTTAVRERVQSLARRQLVDRWRDRLRHLGQLAVNRGGAAPPPVPERLDLRLRITSEDWSLETRSGVDGSWKPVARSFGDRLARDDLVEVGNAAVSPDVFAMLALCHAHYRRHYGLYLSPSQPSARELLRALLEHRMARNVVVDAAGQPLRFAPEPVHWRLSPANRNKNEYELALELPGGEPLPPSAVHLSGRPDWYVHGGVIYQGPPPLDHNSAAGAVIPREAIEDPDVATLLRRAGTRLPAEVEERFVSVPLQPRIECALEVDFSQNEILTLQLVAQSTAPPATRKWTSRGWVKPDDESIRPPEMGGKIALFDPADADRVAAALPQLNLAYDDYQHRWVRRLTRALPEEFLAWRQALPAGVEVVATGELASLLGAPVRATLDFQLLETAAHRDWFDLALVLKPEDATLTPEELALLLKARGKLVRIPGKGWRRLTVELDTATATALEDAGLDRDALATAALTGERHRFHALQLNQSRLAARLPERQAEALRARAREIALPAPPPLPPELQAELRPYQKDGFHFLAFLSANRLGGVLADDMGLGKTVQTLAWLLWLAGRKPAGEPLRALVVCPKSVVGNWESEAARFAPSLAVVRFSPAMRASGPETRDRRPAPGKDSKGETGTANGAGHQILVANYAQLRLGADFFSARQWDAVVLDEGQFIKTPSSQVAQVARELPGEHRLVLTGTPIENRLLDLWSLFSFALPGLLGPQTAFKRHYNQENPLALPRLRARVRHFLLRRTKAQVAADLPARTEEELMVELEGEQAKLYQTELKRARAQLLKVQSTRELDKMRFNILASLLRLRQICCHPGLVDPNRREADSAKLAALMERVEELQEEGHQVLVFSQFVEMLELIRAKLLAAGIGHLMLTGQTENRDALVRQFQSEKQHTVFLLSLKAAGFGLNLTAASYVILYDPWWNPAVEAQAIDRTHRIGQQVPVFAYRLIARGTIEEKIRTLQREKAALAGAIITEESLASVLDLESLRQILA